MNIVRASRVLSKNDLIKLLAGIACKTRRKDGAAIHLPYSFTIGDRASLDLPPAAMVLRYTDVLGVIEEQLDGYGLASTASTLHSLNSRITSTVHFVLQHPQKKANKNNFKLRVNSWIRCTICHRVCAHGSNAITE